MSVTCPDHPDEKKLYCSECVDSIKESQRKRFLEKIDNKIQENSNSAKAAQPLHELRREVEA